VCLCLARRCIEVLTLSVQKPNGFSRMPGGKSEVYRLVRKEKEEYVQTEIVKSALVEYGLSENETEVYLYLARKGESKA
jgi:hypothetical protein